LPKLPLLKARKLVKVLSKETLEAINGRLTEVLKRSNEERQGFVQSFILLEYNEATKQVTTCTSFKPLLEESEEGVIHYIAYIDPSNGYPSVVLKNIIGAIGMNIKEEKKQVRFIPIRDKLAKEGTKVELKDSLYFEISIDKLSSIDCDTWILDEKSKPQEWNIDLKQVMDRELYFLAHF
jgi:hypothetical protein